MITLPVDLQSLLTLFATQAFIGSLISLIMEQVPFIKNPLVANWKKLLVIGLICVAWSILSTLVLQHGLPQDANGWYTLLLTAVMVLLTNQTAYQLVATVFPGIANWLLLFSGKAPMIAISTNRPAVPPRPPAYQVRPEDIIPNASTGATS